MPAVPRLAVSATRGGGGKTTVSLGIIAAWKKRGRRIAVFKKGPDFIDAGWLGAAARRPCYNLDLFMMQPASVLASFADHSADADGAVIEGNRGLYDGVDESGTYSTARLAKLLEAPVVLIVDCTKASSTVGAVVLGCRNYDPGIRLSGVILNNLSGARHETVIRKAIEQSSGIRVVGAIPRQRKGEFPERHMGLTPFHEHPDVERAINAATDAAERYLDLDGLWSIACRAGDLAAERPKPGIDSGKDNGYCSSPVIGIIRDTAFQFYYPDNLEALEQHGARLEFINALKDRTLPDVDALYIGGGFPETQAAELAANGTFCESVRTAAEKGLPIYAECGGLIYLGRSLAIGEKRYSMAGVLPADFVLEKKPQAHGYTVVRAGNSPFFDEGVIIRGHEFHYSRIVNLDASPQMAYHMVRGSGIDGKSDGLVFKNVLGTYTHLHALGTSLWAETMVKKACEYREHSRHRE